MSELISDHITNHFGAELLTKFFVKASLKLVSEGQKVVVVGILGVNFLNSQDVVVDVDLITKEFLVPTF